MIGYISYCYVACLFYDLLPCPFCWHGSNFEYESYNVVESFRPKICCKPTKGGVLKLILIIINNCCHKSQDHFARV